MRRAAAGIVVLGAVAACATPPAREGGISRSETVFTPVAYDWMVDLLFVVDDSPAMAGAQDALAADAARISLVLGQLGGPTDLHVGVTTARGDGALVGGDCPGLAPRSSWLHDGLRRDGSTVRDYRGELRDALSCMLARGASGPSVRQPLEAMRAALANNPGFVRRDALLYVVLVTSGDDCSLAPGASPADALACTEAAIACDEPDLRTPGEKHHCRARDHAPLLTDLDEYRAFLRQLKPPGAVRVGAVIAPDAPVAVVATADGPALAPSCTAASASATPALRLAAFLDDPRLRASPCDGDVTDALAQLAARRSLVGHGCFAAHPRPDDCAVELVRTDRWNGGEIEASIPACAPARYATPCWHWTVDPWCPYIDVDAPDQLLPPDTYLRATCAVE